MTAKSNSTKPFFFLVFFLTAPLILKMVIAAFSASNGAIGQIVDVVSPKAFVFGAGGGKVREGKTRRGNEAASAQLEDVLDV